jgi:hypothetical protein
MNDDDVDACGGNALCRGRIRLADAPAAGGTTGVVMKPNHSVGDTGLVEHAFGDIEWLAD